MSNETQKFANWFEKEKSEGLVDIKFFTGDINSTSSEHFFREANAMQEACVVDVVEKDYAENFEQFQLASPMV